MRYAFREQLWDVTNIRIRLEIEIEIKLNFDQLKQSSLILRLVFFLLIG